VSWGEPPVEVGPLVPPVVVSVLPPPEVSVVGGETGEDGSVGVVVVVVGVGTGVPGSWMSLSEVPSGASTVTGTTSPVWSWT